MTEYELVDLLNSTATVIAANVSIYLTIVSAYLVVAYTSGKNLLSSQLFILNLLFFTAAEFFSIGAYAASNRASFTSAELISLGSDYPFSFPRLTGLYILVVSQLGIIMSFKFMFDTRGGMSHP